MGLTLDAQSHTTDMHKIHAQHAPALSHSTVIDTKHAQNPAVFESFVVGLTHCHTQLTCTDACAVIATYNPQTCTDAYPVHNPRPTQIAQNAPLCFAYPHVCMGFTLIEANSERGMERQTHQT
jgi:hypothetical protein